MKGSTLQERLITSYKTLFRNFILGITLLVSGGLSMTHAQCTNTSSYLSVTAPTEASPLKTVATCTYAGEYNTVQDIVAGSTYTITSVGGGGNYLTIREGTYDGVVIASGYSPLTITPSSSGSIFIHINLDDECSSQSACRTLTVKYEEISCLNTWPYGTTSAPSDDTPVTSSSCNWADEYHKLVDCVEGSIYTISSSINTDVLTIRLGTYDGAIIAAGQSPLIVTAPSNEDLYIHITLDENCTTDSGCRYLTFECTSCQNNGTECLNNLGYGSLSAPDGPPVTSTSCNYAGEYFTLYNSIAGETYIISSSIATDYLTIRQGAYNGSVVESGISGLSVTSPINGDLYIHINSDSDCGTENTCRYLTVECASCPVDPCSDITEIQCGETYNATLIPNAGTWTNYTGGSYTYNGSEKVWEFTPQFDGEYIFHLDEGDNDADFFFMSDCDPNSTNILGSGYWSGLNVQTIELTGGVTYYLIADLYSSSATTVEVSVECPTPDYDCDDQFVLSENYDEAFYLGNTNGQNIKLAFDVVSGSQPITANGIKVNLYSEIGEEVTLMDVNIYSDDSGLPGTVTETRQAIAVEKTYLTQNYGYDLYEYTFIFNTPITFDENSISWFELIGDEATAWERTNPNSSAVFESFSVVNWDANGNIWENEDNVDLIYTLICDEIAVNCDDFEVNITGDSDICEGESIVLTATSSDLNATFEWNDGSNGSTFSVSSGGTYSVTATSENGLCSDNIDFVVNEHDLPNVDLGADIDACIGDNVTLESGNTDSNATVLWSNGSTDNNLIISTSGNYSVTITNEFGCESNSSVEVSFHDSPSVDLGADIDACDGDHVTLESGNTDSNATVLWSDGSADNNLIVTTSGNYSVTITNEYGCEASGSVEVSFDPLPSISGIDITDNSNGNYSFSATGVSNADNYQWDFGDGNSSTSSSPNYTYSSEGTYIVTVTVTNDCGSVSESTEVVYSTSGLQEVELSNIVLYPNPTKDNVTIENGGSVAMEQIRIYNSFGQMVYDDKVENGSVYIFNVNQLSDGLYHVTIQFKNGDLVQRKFNVIK